MYTCVSKLLKNYDIYSPSISTNLSTFNTLLIKCTNHFLVLRDWSFRPPELLQEIIFIFKCNKCVLLSTKSGINLRDRHFIAWGELHFRHFYSRNMCTLWVKVNCRYLKKLQFKYLDYTVCKPCAWDCGKHAWTDLRAKCQLCNLERQTAWTDSTNVPHFYTVL